MSKTFEVVEFLGYSCVEVVPRSWLSRSEQGTFVYWPRFGGASRAKRCELPDKEKWKRYAVRSFCSTDDYEKAIFLAKRAEETSNLDTAEEEEPSKRKKKRPSKYGNSDSGDDADLEEEDMSSSFRKTDFRNGPILPHASPVLPTPPRASPVLPMPPRPSPVTPTPPRTPVMPEEEPEPVTRASFPSMSSISVPLTNDSFDDGPTGTEVTNDTRVSTPIHGRRESSSTTREHGFHMNILMRLTAIENQVTEQNAMLRTIISSLSLSVDETEDLVPEPLDTEEELLSLCEKLANKPYKKKMILFLSALGGLDIGDSVRRMMRKIGTNKLWSGYNLKGRNKKKSFEGLRICGVIKKAYQRSHPKVDEKQIEGVISTTLKQAPFKKGGVQTTVQVPADGARASDMSDTE